MFVGFVEALVRLANPSELHCVVARQLVHLRGNQYKKEGGNRTVVMISEIAGPVARFEPDDNTIYVAFVLV